LHGLKDHEDQAAQAGVRIITPPSIHQSINQSSTHKDEEQTSPPIEA
jgi:hypothetical protein